MSNRVEELESRVAELQAAVDGLTEELVETRERLRALEEDDVGAGASGRSETVTPGGAEGRSDDATDENAEAASAAAEGSDAPDEPGTDSADAPSSESESESSSDSDDIIVA